MNRNIKSLIQGGGVLLFFLGVLGLSKIDAGIAKGRARDFCDAFAMGETLNPQKVQTLLATTDHQIAAQDAGRLHVTFPTYMPLPPPLPQHGCFLSLQEGKVVLKDVD